jgi:hypothetical protein
MELHQQIRGAWNRIEETRKGSDLCAFRESLDEYLSVTSPSGGPSARILVWGRFPGPHGALARTP